MALKVPTHVSGIPLRYILGALALLAGFLYLRYAPDSMKPWTNAPQPAQQAQEPHVVERIVKVLVPGPDRIRVIEKIKYVKKVPGALTPATMADNTANVIASVTIPPSASGGIASSILRTGPDGVGVGTIEFRPATPKFFAVQKEFGVRAGMGTGGLVLGELYARPLRIGPVTVEVRGFGKRDDRSGADFGAAILADMRF
jgi:hypothetical protein